MVRTIIALSIAVATPAWGQTLQPTPAALEIFERDWVLMNWALKYYDANGDILLEPNEARAAADAFRRIADVNRDGRISQQEYRAARDEILARY
jgi:hypothetical protein